MYFRSILLPTHTHSLFSLFPLFFNSFPPHPGSCWACADLDLIPPWVRVQTKNWSFPPLVDDLNACKPLIQIISEGKCSYLRCFLHGERGLTLVLISILLQQSSKDLFLSAKTILNLNPELVRKTLGSGNTWYLRSPILIITNDIKSPGLVLFPSQVVEMRWDDDLVNDGNLFSGGGYKEDTHSFKTKQVL